MLEIGSIIKIKSGNIEIDKYNDIKIEKPCKIKIVKKWYDNEIGYRFIGKNKEQQTVYFGQFDLLIPTYKNL